MGITSDFIKLRSTGTPKVGEWNINYDLALQNAILQYKFIVTVWSNGDRCGNCTNSEKCMMTTAFKDWMKKTDAYFVFQYSGDKDKGKVAYDWLYNKQTGLRVYPGFRINLYNYTGKMLFDQAIDGNKLRGNKFNDAGAKIMMDNLDAIFAKKQEEDPVESEKEDVDVNYKIRLNEKLTVKKINAILDAIDKNDGYCPCQPKDPDSKCHCVDFIKNKGFDEPCICNIYVKKQK